MGKRKIALAGIGKIAIDQHIPTLGQSEEWELAAAVSRNHRVDGIANYQDFAQMLDAQPEIGAVSLCMPPVPRFVYAVAALEAGRHVMLEKPPGATLSEVHDLERIAAGKGLTLFTSWHSRAAHFVGAAKEWLRGKRITRFIVTWHEDVRKWHPGQDWVFEPGGMGVFDPGINALSIVTEILPDAIHLTSAELEFPANRQTPIAARLSFFHPHGADVSADMNWDHQGADIWNIKAETDQGVLLLQNGGAVMSIDGATSGEIDGLDGEYPELYRQFARLVADGGSDVDLRPMTHVSDALTIGHRRIVDPFHWSG